jgi:hypothetical protein
MLSIHISHWYLYPYRREMYRIRDGKSRACWSFLCFTVSAPD